MVHSLVRDLILKTTVIHTIQSREMIVQAEIQQAKSTNGNRCHSDTQLLGNLLYATKNDVNHSHETLMQ